MNRRVTGCMVAWLAAAAILFMQPVIGAQKHVTPAASKAKPQVRPSAPARETTAPASEPDASCTVDSIDPRSNERVTYTVRVPTPGTRQRVASCLLPVKQAMQRVAKGDLLLIDVRNADAFEQYRIPGSLNAPLPFVKTKAFLKTRAFALVNEGRQTAELEAACQALRGEGFANATVLQGGLGAWRKAKGELEGDVLAQRDLNRMRSIEFAEEGNYADWLVVSVAGTSMKEVQALLPRAVVMKRSDDAALANSLKAVVVKRARKGVDLKVLIVDDDGSRYDRIEKVVSGALSQNVYFLEGGLAAYRKFWSEQATIWAAAAKPPRKPMCGA